MGDIDRSEDWEEDWEENNTGRFFLYKEAVLSGFYSSDGIVGVPLNDRSEDHFEFSPRPPGNYVALDYVHTFTSSSPINRNLLPKWLPLTAINLHPRVLFDRMEDRNGFDRVKFAPQDFWVRLNPGGGERFTLRLGQFVIPYGANPILAPRQRFLLPIEASDLGLKWDWGLHFKGPVGQYDWELAATVGSGEALRSPRLFRGSKDSTSYLISGRVGTPTYWDFQYGLSFLIGDIPMIRGAKVFERYAFSRLRDYGGMGECRTCHSPVSVSRWRVGADSFYRMGTYLMGGAQVTYGQDGFAGDEDLVDITHGKIANVLGYRAWIDWVVPYLLDLRLAAQFESVIRALSMRNRDDTALTLEATYSLTTGISAMLDYRMELSRSMGEAADAIYFTVIYYGR